MADRTRDERAYNGTHQVRLNGGLVRFERVVSEAGSTGRGAPLSCDDDYMVTVQLVPQASQVIWRGGERIAIPAHAGGAVFIVNMTERWQCERQGPYDNLTIRIGFSAFRALARDLGFEGVQGLDTVLGAGDPVLSALARAWISAFPPQGDSDGLLLPQLVRTMFVHLIDRHGRREPGEGGKRRLSQVQEDAAKAFMRANAGRIVSLEEIAAATGLSRGYFSRAFSATVGITPFRWLMSYRIQRARDMLAEGLPIAEIAAACGFSDQSHLNRVFARETGVSPAQWRKHGAGEG